MDLRKCYLTDKEIAAWDTRGILYNSIWYLVNKPGHDVEFSTCAIDSFRKLEKYKNATTKKHKPRGEVLICSVTADPNCAITADLMTGWWNPFKHFIGIKSKKSLHGIYKELSELEDKEGQDQSRNSELEKSWLIDKRTEYLKSIKGREVVKEDVASACDALISFLGVVYTTGNIIPAAVNPGSGGMDGWHEKWWKNISLSDDDEKKYVSDHKLWMYFKKDEDDDFTISDGKLKFIGIDSFGKMNGFGKKNCKEWQVYFDYYKNAIDKRNEVLNAGIDEMAGEN